MPLTTEIAAVIHALIDKHLGDISKFNEAVTSAALPRAALNTKEIVEGIEQTALALHNPILAILAAPMPKTLVGKMIDAAAKNKMAWEVIVSKNEEILKLAEHTEYPRMDDLKTATKGIEGYKGAIEAKGTFLGWLMS